MPRPHVVFLSLLFVLPLSTSASAQSPAVLYTWEDTGDERGWTQQFGDNVLVLVNETAGELTIREEGPDALAGAGAAFGDSFDLIREGNPALGGLDLTGLESLEFDLGHDGAAAVSVQFFVSATPTSEFIPLGDDQPIEPGMNTYRAPLSDLSAEQIAYIRSIGVNVREHFADGNLEWTLAEVRSAGEPLGSRDIATHEPGSPDAGLNGVLVNFDNVAVEGNDGGQNQSGLSVNTDEPPTGNTGSLHWVDLANGPGAAVSWHNGTVLFSGNTFWERPIDLSNYTDIVLRIAATNRGGNVATVDVQYWLQVTQSFSFRVAGLEALTADGEFHELTFRIADIPNLDTVMAHGVNLGAHPDGDISIDVDFVRALTRGDFPDCNENGRSDIADIGSGDSQDCNFNGIPDECDIADGSEDDCNENGIPDTCELAGTERTRVLYTWAGVGDTRGWFKNFGTNDVEFDNSIAGELSIFEVGEDGTTVAISDDFNAVAEGAPTLGGLDLTGFTELEFDFGHDGVGPVNVQFFVQASPDSTYVALGPDQPIEPDVATYRAPLDDLTPAQLAYIRTIGINIRGHTEQQNLLWTLAEIRTVGTQLTQRDYATHEPGSSDNGLQGAVVAFDNLAVLGNSGQQDQSGLSHNTTDTPSGNTGSLRWIDVAEANGGAVAWFNGTAWNGDTFNERPTDMSPYDEVTIRMAAANTAGGEVITVGVQYFVMTGDFNFHPAGELQELDVDGEYHELTFPLEGIPDLEYVVSHGVDLAEHLGGNVIIDVDGIRTTARRPTENDCNANGILDECEGLKGGCGEPEFRRSDTNTDGTVNIADPVFALNFLFGGGPVPTCPDATDANDDGTVNIADPVYSLNALFAGGPPPPAPGAEQCGEDPTADGLGECLYGAACS